MKKIKLIVIMLILINLKLVLGYNPIFDSVRLDKCNGLINDNIGELNKQYNCSFIVNPLFLFEGNITIYCDKLNYSDTIELNFTEIDYRMSAIPLIEYQYKIPKIKEIGIYIFHFNLTEKEHPHLFGGVFNINNENKSRLISSKVIQIIDPLSLNELKNYNKWSIIIIIIAVLTLFASIIQIIRQGKNNKKVIILINK